MTRNDEMVSGTIFYFLNEQESEMEMNILFVRWVYSKSYETPNTYFWFHNLSLDFHKTLNYTLTFNHVNLNSIMSTQIQTKVDFSVQICNNFHNKSSRL